MTVPGAYLTTARNIGPILADIQRAGVPGRFTYEFLKQLGHPSSANRPAIGVLKALGFLSDSGEPTERYRRYKDPAQAKAVLAEGLRAAYADVFTVDQHAHERTTNELKGIFARLSDKGDAVNLKMATTFKTLADMADFSAVPSAVPSENGQKRPAEAGGPTVSKELRQTSPPDAVERQMVVHHDVHVHLPISTDIAVYDAIFRSIRENLL